MDLKAQALFPASRFPSLRSGFRIRRGIAATVAIAAALGFTAMAGAAEGSGGRSAGDINGDQVVNVFDLLIVLGEWGGGTSGADVNGDGAIDVFDLLAILQGWGSIETDTNGPLNPAQYNATLLWYEDFELGNYSRWTGGYNPNFSNCVDNGFANFPPGNPRKSHMSTVYCDESPDYAHRGYGGIQFTGNSVAPAYTNSGHGVQAPHGIVNTFWTHLEAGQSFVSPRWFSFWTVTGACDYSDRVITFGLENASNVITPAHILNTGGTVTFASDAPAYPMGEWVRLTVYINYHTGDMHLWQNGETVWSATFTRDRSDICQWHWGLYASEQVGDATLHEDDISIHKLNSPWQDFSVEPWFHVP